MVIITTLLLFSDLKRYLLNILSILSMKRRIVVRVASGIRYKQNSKNQINGHETATTLVVDFVLKIGITSWKMRTHSLFFFLSFFSFLFFFNYETYTTYNTVYGPCITTYY